MNDNETKVMTFSTVTTGSLEIPISSTYADGKYDVLGLLGSSYGTPSSAAVPSTAGRAYYAGMMFDRLRFRSVSVTIRPKTMPSSTATNYNFWTAWDRYGHFSDDSAETGGKSAYSIMTDPSAKQVVWTPGGSGTSLRTWIRSTSKDRYQYFSINHGEGSWSLNVGSSQLQYQTGFFYPHLLFAVDAVTAGPVTIQFTLQCRFVIEFQGGYSNTTLNYTSGSTLTAAKNVMSPEEIPNAQPDESAQYLAQQFQRMQTSLPTISRR